MTAYVVRRVWQMIPTILGVILLIFILFNWVGGDPAQTRHEGAGRRGGVGIHQGGGGGGGGRAPSRAPRQEEDQDQGQRHSHRGPHSPGRGSTTGAPTRRITSRQARVLW